MRDPESIGTITAVPGIRVGQAQRIGDGWLSGVSVILPDAGTVAGVDVRGGGPGTHETDALDPRTLVQTIDALVLTGGSAFGLVTAHGVQRWCAEHGVGFRVGPEPDAIVPIVPAAAIFDLGRGGDFGAYPTIEMGYAAAAAAAATEPFTPIERGNVGAGTGAAISRGRYKGGVGSAALRLPAPNEHIVVGAIAVVNAAGAPWDASFDVSDLVAPPPGPPAPEAGGELPALNTTIAAVATNAILDPAEASRTATAAHDGMARALNPVHTLADGDTIFALATGKEALFGNDRHTRVGSLFALHAYAAEAIRLAINDGIASATPVSTPAVTLARFGGN
ncbi:MAG: P1 family peptidase [Gordonia sp. (in: high G+C Gram-positive bacteria)]